MRALQTYKGYIVDYRLREFRKVMPKRGLSFVPFKSQKGDNLLSSMIKKDLVPYDTLCNLF